MNLPSSPAPSSSPGFVRQLTFMDSTMIVVGSMIGSGIFIVPADIARLVGSAGWILIVWVVTGLLTIAGALCYGELGAMMPRAGGQYIFLREAYSPMVGFLYGWALFLVIQTGTIAAVAVGFARFLGVLVPGISASHWILPPMNISNNYAISLSTQQLAAIALLIALTFLNTRGIHLGKVIQNTFTSAKTIALLALVMIGTIIARNPEAIAANFTIPWSPRNVVTIQPDLAVVPQTAATAGLLGLFVAICIAQVGSLFSADAWHNVTFTAGEVKQPQRTLPLSLITGTAIVVALYLLTNLAYLFSLPVEMIQAAPDDRVGTAVLQAAFGSIGATAMAFAIIVSTTGANNGLILSGARVYYAMARDGLFFKKIGRLNNHQVPGWGLILQCIWAVLLVLPRVRLRDSVGTELRDPASGQAQYGNLYGNLLDYVVFTVLLFYILTILGLFRLRRKWPTVEGQYRTLGYPLVPLLYVLVASTILVVLLCYRTATTWPGLLIVLSGMPIFFVWRHKAEHRLPVPDKAMPSTAKQ